jgi:methylase of polypeptide subunit release factors
LADWAKIVLKNEGKLIAECHSKYTSEVASLWKNYGLVEVEEHNDLSNLPRFVTAVFKK